MQIRTIEEYNHLKKVFFSRTKELNEIQSILDMYAETFEPKLKIEDPSENISQEGTPNELNTPNIKKINSQKTKRKPKKKS